MNWLQAQVEPVSNVDVEYWNTHYPLAEATVGGLRVEQSGVPNAGSISSSFNDWQELSGLREISDFENGKPTDTFYAANDIKHSSELAEEIRSSGWISPLIIAINKNGPYILEGIHRFVALGELGVQSFPALVVIDLDENNE